MNIKKLSKRLSKIDMLLKSIKEDGKASKIERDLLLSYLREAYEYASESESEELNKNKLKSTPPKTKLQEQTPVFEAQPTDEVIQQIVQEEVIPEPQPVVTSVKESSTPAKEVIQGNTNVSATSEDNVPQVLLDIFQPMSISELSDKLSMSPITDMTKSMGINERIFTVKELFGGDNDSFNSILQRINSFSSYDEARSYLMTGIARDQDWANESKIKKAEHFVKLVKRRFLK